MTGRNDLSIMKVAYDNENIYFYAETKNEITPYMDPNWMNLFIGLAKEDGSLRFNLPNWEGYQFVLNRENVGEGVTRLERSTGGWNWDVAHDYIPYKVKGNKMEVAIPRETLGISKKQSNIDIVFKWCDNINVDDNIMTFYTDGDTAPNARFYYLFNSGNDTDSQRSK